MLKGAVLSGSEIKMQQQFLKTRNSYKEMEAIVEYYYSFHAITLNGPPIPFYEEDESDIPERKPAGLQVIEGILFPHLQKNSVAELKKQLDEVYRQAVELPTVPESFEFDDVHIFDAIMEEIYRVTAMGITGFDSQTAMNGLPECQSALNGIGLYLNFYKPAFDKLQPGKFVNLTALIRGARQYLKQNNNFNAFDRMHFINTYLTPIASLTGKFKFESGFKDNESAMYYSAVNKNSSLFATDIFKVQRFFDDASSSLDKIELGRKLFSETRLSSSNSRSCASCHNPAKAFTDGLRTSFALDGHSPLRRNAPTLLNAALQRNLFLDSRSRNLEDQVLQVLNNALEMHGSAQQVSEKIITQSNYATLYAKAYPDQKITDAAKNISNAIACYERTLITLNSRFDKQMNGAASFNSREIKGFNLFMGKAKCGTCHFMPLFSGAKPPRYYYIESEVIGVPKNSSKKFPVLDSDSGRYYATGFSIHLHSFKTPTLRNVALTAPYMHNGVFKSLEEVINFYNNGGGRGLKIAPFNESLPFESLGLNQNEKKELISFMKTLTDTSITQKFSGRF